MYFIAKAMRHDLVASQDAYASYFLWRSSPPVSSARGLFLGRVQPPRSRISKRFFGPEPASQYGSVEQQSGDKVSHFVAKDLTRPIVLQLVERELRFVVLSIKADALHPRLQRETLLPLSFGAITQIVYALLETTNLRLQLQKTIPN